MRKVLILQQPNKFTYCNLKGYIDRFDHIAFHRVFQRIHSTTMTSVITCLLKIN